MSKPIHIRLLSRLQEIAEAGDPCPRAADLAAYLGVTKCTAYKAFERLVEDNRIATKRVGNRRQVTILPNGPSTADPTHNDIAVVRPRVREIVRVAAEVFDTTAKDLLGRSQFAEHVAARNAACVIAHNRGWQYTDIARVLGKDHSTVIHGVRRASDIAARDPFFAARLHQLNALIPQSQMREVA